MSHIGNPVREDVIIKRTVIVAVPDVEIVSVPVRPSEQAARRRKIWEGPQPEPEKQPVAVPVRREEKSPL
jgi:hypothetical protein